LGKEKRTGRKYICPQRNPMNEQLNNSKRAESQALISQLFQSYKNFALIMKILEAPVLLKGKKVKLQLHSVSMYIHCGLGLVQLIG
jgi:hypothetical protein